jgi:putative membrane protein
MTSGKTKEEKMKFLINFLKGLVIGIATLVPGVSGGTMAVILGVYDDLIHAIGSFFEDWKKHSIILLQIGLGGLAGLLLFSKLLENVLQKYPFGMRFFFIGVIFGGIPVLYKKSTTAAKRSIKDLIFFVIGLVIVLLLSSEPAATTSLATSKGMLSIIFLFIAGIVMAVALILPGISGSFMLFVLGLYSVTLNAINTRNIPFLIPLGIGVVLGTLGTAKTIEKLLEKYPSRTYMLILGFVAGSLLPVFPGIPTGFSVVTSAAALIVGFLLINWLSKKEI